MRKISIGRVSADQTQTTTRVFARPRPEPAVPMHAMFSPQSCRRAISFDDRERAGALPYTSRRSVTRKDGTRGRQLICPTAGVSASRPSAVHLQRIPHQRVADAWVADAWGRGRAAEARSLRSPETMRTVNTQYGNNKQQGFDSSRRCKRADGPLCSALPVCRVGAGHRLRAKRASPCLRTGDNVGIGRSCHWQRGAATHACSLDRARGTCDLPRWRGSKRLVAWRMAT